MEDTGETANPKRLIDEMTISELKQELNRIEAMLACLEQARMAQVYKGERLLFESFEPLTG